MIRVAFIGAIMAVTASSLLAHEEVPISDGDAFVLQFDKICLASGNDVEKVRAMAEADGWESIDPDSLPAKSNLSIQKSKRGKPERVERSDSWRVTLNGNEYFVGLTEMPENYKSRCEIMTFNGDNEESFSVESVDASITNLTDVEKPPALFPGMPLKVYRAKMTNSQITYIASDAGDDLLHYIFTN